MSTLDTKPDVFLLSAGLGVRLRPLTDKTPKPLIPVNGVPLIERHLRALRAEGFSRVMVNLHHLGEKIRAFLGDGSRFSMEISYSDEPELLDTGGGIKQIEPWLRGEELLVVNSDSLFDNSVRYSAVLGGESVMTLLVGPDRGFTKLFVDGAGRLLKFNEFEGPNPVNYLGVMALKRSLIQRLPSGKFSIASGVIPGLLERGEVIRTVRFDGYFSDVGTSERLAAASNYLRSIEGDPSI